jgi:hypothetical protein
LNNFHSRHTDFLFNVLGSCYREAAHAAVGRRPLAAYAAPRMIGISC